MGIRRVARESDRADLEAVVNKDQPRIPKGFVGAGRFMKVGQVLVAVAKDAARPGDGGGRKPGAPKLAKAGSKLTRSDDAIERTFSSAASASRGTKVGTTKPGRGNTLSASARILRGEGWDTPPGQPMISPDRLRDLASDDVSASERFARLPLDEQVRTLAAMSPDGLDAHLKGLSDAEIRRMHTDWFPGGKAGADQVAVAPRAQLERSIREAVRNSAARSTDGQHPPTPDGVRAAYMDLVREQGRDNPDDAPYVSLADLRERLGGTREEQDAALREIEQHGDTNIVPQANQKVTSDRTRSGAVRIGGQDKSHIAIGPNIGEPGPVDVAARRRESAASRKADAEARAAASAKTTADREARYSTPQAQTQIRADAAEIRAEHPDWSDAQVRAELERDYPAGAVGKAIQAKPSAAPSRRAAATADAAAEIAKLRSELDYVESSRDTHGDRGRDPNSVARRGRNAAAAAIRQRIADLEAGTASPALPDAEVDARIARAYADLARPGQHLSLVRLRDRLQDIDRPTLDRALKRLDRARVIQLDAEPNQKGLPLAARDASIRQGGEDRHLITSRELHGRASTSPDPAAQPARTAKPTKARLASVGAKLTPAAPPPTPLGGQLQKAASREQAHQLIAPLTVVELRDLAKELGVPVRSGANKTALRNAIVQLAVGVRLDSKAINPG